MAHKWPFRTISGHFLANYIKIFHKTKVQMVIFRCLAQRRKTETKPDTYSKDRMFVTSFAFCVITFEPIEVQTCSAPQNDRQNLGFVKDINVVVEKMTRNCHKSIGKMADSLLCPLHSIQCLPLVFLPLC